MDLRINNAQMGFKRLTWNEGQRERTQYAIAEVMRRDKLGEGAVSFDVLEDQFNKIDDLEEDVILSCSVTGTEDGGFFGLMAYNRQGNILADMLLGATREPKKDNEKVIGFYDSVVKKIDELKSARHLTEEQEEYYKDAKDYMKIFDRCV